MAIYQRMSKHGVMMFGVREIWKITEKLSHNLSNLPLYHPIPIILANDELLTPSFWLYHNQIVVVRQWQLIYVDNNWGNV